MAKELTKKDEVVSFEGWKTTRKSFIENIQTIMAKGKDYHDLNFRGKEVRVLAKGGAEKVASAFGWTASFTRDLETVEMLGLSAGVAYLCKITDKKGKVIGEGRGARKLVQDNGDPNKTIKMAQKSAFIDAVLRTSGLSDIFTQDLEDENGHAEPKIEHVERVIDEPEPIVIGTDTDEPKPVRVKPLKSKIVSVLKNLGVKAVTAEEYQEEVKKLTELELVPENYAEIIARLEVVLAERKEKI